MSQSPEEALRVQRYEDGWEAINRMIREDLSWGGSERKCLHAACADGTFAPIAGAAGTDFLDDGRALCVLDIERDGRPDLVLRNRTGPQVRVLLNVWPRAGQAIWIRCEGRSSNRDGVGARVTVRTARGERVKEVQAGSFFLSQSSRWLCFGLGKDPGEVEAEVRWPGGGVQRLGKLAPGRRYLVREGEAPAAEPFAEPGAAALGGAAAPRASPAPTSAGEAPEAVATWLIEPLPAPDFALPALAVTAANAASASGELLGPSRLLGKPLVVHFLSIACPACAAEVAEVRRAEALVESAGGRVLHVVADATAAPDACAEGVRRLGYRSPTVRADGRALAAWNIVHRHLWSLRRDLAVPSSFLLDASGAIVKAWRGGAAASWAADVRRIPRDAAARLALALPFPGTALRPAFHRDLLGLGNAFFEAGLHGEARAVFAAALGRHAEDSDSLFNYAVACAEGGRLEDAERAYRRVLELAPSLDDARNNVGTLLAKAGRAEEALGMFRAIVERNPAHAEAVLNLSNELLKAGHAQEALQVCEGAVARDPESAPFRRQLGYARYRAGYRDLAVESTREALRIDPRDADSWLNLANYLTALGDLAGAKGAALAGLERRPGHAGLLNTLGMVHAALGEVDEAARHLERAIAADPRLAPPYTNLARLHLERGDRERARDALRRLLAVLPGHAAALEMLREVGQ
ncbi:MAG: tetratricopeptide repeat protein [Planctomycetes bacterium]|nr:tetratricopeptide repeat protein [Planctomycetota bacterium]